jgi:hypothetical protein
MLERDAIIDTITTLFIATDERDWQAVKRVLAPQVLFDMTSAVGGKPATVSAQSIVDGWDTGLRPIKALHHQVGNFRVEVSGARASASCYGIAYHYLPNPSGRNTRVFVGSYDFALARSGDDWRITEFRFNLKFIDGNAELGS